MNQKNSLKISQNRHRDLWRKTINGGKNDEINHQYHARVITIQYKEGRRMTAAEKKKLYRKIVKGKRG